jgi:DUF1365 family protein
MKSESSRSTQFESAIYKGVVRHRRFTPATHEFDYSIFMLLLKADEIPQVMQKFWQLGTNALRWGRFNRRDYIGDTDSDLSQAVKSKIAEKLGVQAGELSGDVYFLGQLRYFGFYFSPLNLYFLKQDDQFKYMLAEVSNTPWNEKHYYLVNLQEAQRHRKEFHVSPFNPMQQDYQWRVVPPAADHEHCLVHIDIFGKSENQKKVFDATLNLSRVTLNQTQLMRVLLTTPIQTFSIVTGIYWQALKLLLKRMPLYPHPNKTSSRIKKGIV